MTTNLLRRCVCVIFLGLLSAVVAPVFGDEKPSEKVKPKKPVLQVISVTIHPAAAPVPALKYHLLPTFLEQTAGNAVPVYVKVLMGYVDFERRMVAEYDQHPDRKADICRMVEWLETPLDALPLDRVRKLTDFGMPRSLESAVRRERCDWDMPLREGRLWEVILPEMQELDHLSELLALRARLQIAEKKQTEAIATMKIGYGMARQIAECPFLVTAMIGNRIVQKMNDQLLTLCQQPNAPNLYWSLSELPSPVINIEKALKVEYEGFFLGCPEFQDLRRQRNAPEQWDLLLRRFVSEVVRFEYLDTGKKPEKDRASTIMARVLAAVSEAKTDLIAAGYSPKDVEAMPASQIVLLQTLEMYDRYRDEFYKWLRLPYWQAEKGLAELERNMKSAKKLELIPMPLMFISDSRLSRSLFYLARTERQLAALRCIEALRMYAASHKGKLPVSLDDIKETPIPINPVTGRVFPYHLEGETAVLDADGGPENVEHARTQYRITVAEL
jgi:hypothetical protein